MVIAGLKTEVISTHAALQEIQNCKQLTFFPDLPSMAHLSSHRVVSASSIRLPHQTSK
jgi:sulfur transfer protein SufE